MRMKALLLLALTWSVGVGAQAPEEWWDPDHGISFRFPSDWGLEIGHRDGSRIYRLDPPGWEEMRKKSTIVESHVLELEVFDGDLEKAALRAGFTRNEEQKQWLLGGRGADSPRVLELKGAGYDGKSWFGLAGESLVGAHYVGGGYAGLRLHLGAAISDGRRAVTIDLARAEEYEHAFWLVVGSFQFIKPRPN
jgi:hypothetical protein